MASDPAGPIFGRDVPGCRVAADARAAPGLAPRAVPARDRRADRSRRSRPARSPTRAGSGARPPTTSGSPGSDGRREVLDASRGPAWARWWGGGAFDYARAATEPRATRDPGRRGARLGGRGRRRPPADQRASSQAEVDGGRAPLPRARASARATGSGSSCRCSPRRSIAVLALGRIGAIYTPIFSGYAAPAVAARLADCEAPACSITADGFLRRGSWVPLKAVADEAVARTRRPSSACSSSAARATPSDVPWNAGRDAWWHEAVRRPIAAPTADADAPTDPETPYMIIYTSGTTGRPKGAVHVHGGFPIKAAQDLAHRFDLRPGDTLFWFTDLGWMMGPWAISGALLLGARLVLYEGAPDYPGPGPAVGARRAPPGHPPRPLADRHPRADGARRGAGPRPRPVVAAGARLDRRAVEPGAVVVVLPRGRRRAAARSSTTRGGTEVSGGIVGGNLLTPDQAALVLRARASGRPRTSSTTTGSPCAARSASWSSARRCPGMTRGFWRDPRALRGDVLVALPGHRGCTATGRAIDADGFWFIQGRSDDTLKIAGKRVGPGRGGVARRWRTRRSWRRPRSASRTRSRARRSWSCASCVPA